MQVYYPKRWQELEVPWSECSLMFGSFDGLHLGHQYMLQKLLSFPEAESVLLSFHPHPRNIIGDRAISTSNKDLFTWPEKQKIFSMFDVKNLVVLPFDRHIAQLSATDFLQKILQQKLYVKRLLIGYDQHFGHNRHGNYAFLKKTIKEQSLSLLVEQTTAWQKRTGVFQKPIIRTSLIKQLIADGNIAQANAFLGFDYFIMSNIVQGKQLGRKLGFPTANLAIATSKMLPKMGVYACSVRGSFQATQLLAVTNVGVQPTLGDNKKITVETHFLDFPNDRDLYGQNLTVSFLRCIRKKETEFSSLEKLKDQIKKDCDTVRRIYK